MPENTESPNLAPKPIPQIRVLGSRTHAKHPWLLWKSVEKPADRVPPGSVVEFHGDEGFLGKGFYNARARVSGRILTFDSKETLDASLIESRILSAAKKRESMGLMEQTDAWRVVNAEGDGLSGLVIDRYGDLVVLQFFSHGMLRFREVIRKTIVELFPGARLYQFAERHVQKQESFDLRSPEDPGVVKIHENGVLFEVRPGSQHKTGFFLDQRDNRVEFSVRSVGQDVLDLCAHTGAFSIAAMKAGAKSATAVDLDPAAVASAREGALLNGVEIEGVVGDVSRPLAALKGRQYGAVVLDPPKQTRSEGGVGFAIRNYAQMNALALGYVEPGGLLLSCSCTGWVKENAFLEAIRLGAEKAGREIEIEKVTGAGPDHPWTEDFPEGRYLKAAWVKVL